MIFLRRESLKEYIRYYPVTSLLLAAILAMYGVLEWAGSTKDPETLIRYGALYHAAGLPAAEWWRYFTSLFIHIGYQHLLFNGFALYVFAPPLERLLGPIHYLAFFLLTGFAGNALSQWLTEGPYLTAGASGAIYGVYAAYLYLGLFRKHVLDQQSRQTVIAILAVGLVYSLIVPHVNLYGHLGGFLGGLIYFALLVRRFRRRT